MPADLAWLGMLWASGLAAMLWDMADQRIEKWTRWIDGTIKSNVLTMHLHRHAWREVAQILDRHDDDLPESYWWEFMLDTYAVTQAIAVRRQADAHEDAASLRNLIAQVRDDPARITREFWLGLWDDLSDDFDRLIAERDWAAHYGGNVGAHLDPAIPEADLDALTTAAANVKAYADRHIAHTQATAVPASVTLQLKEVHDAIDVIGELFNRYFRLFTAASMATLVPIIQHDWMAVFRVPWIKPDSGG